jgi:hypothetical protein
MAGRKPDQPFRCTITGRANEHRDNNFAKNLAEATAKPSLKSEAREAKHINSFQGGPSMNPKFRHLTSTVFAAALFVAAGFCLTNAFGKQHRISPDSPSAPTSAGERTGIYAVTGFTFTTPQALTHAPIPAVSPCPAPSPNPLGLGCPSIKDQGVEPEIKVDIFGNVYVTAIHGYPGGVDLWKSTDQGTTFVYLGEPDGTQDKCVTGVTPCVGGAGGGDDSIDVSNGGYLYVSSLLPSSVTMSTSMDGGTGGVAPTQAWQVNPASSGIPVNDRQWIAAYGPQTVYMTFDQAPVNTTIWFTKSTDAGKTWAAPTMLIPLQTLSRENNLAVDQYNGNIYTTYTPSGSPNQLNFLKSTDGGATWTNTPAYVGPAGTSVENAFPITAVDRGGNVHIAFTRSVGSTNRTNAHVFLISSGNAGTTWTAPVQIDAGLSNNSTVMPWIVAGSSGVVDVTWYGSSMSSPDNTPSPTDKSTWWNVNFAQVTNALSATPTIAQTVVVGAVHNLPICSRGGNCSGNTRDLSEYYTMTIDQDGNANIAYTDEVDYCAANPAPNCLAHTYYAKQTGGPNAFAPPAGPAPATFATNLVMPNSSGDAEPNMKADSHNCLFSAAPGTPEAWKSTDAGASFFMLPNPVTSAGGIAGGGDSDIFPFTQPSGARPDQLYYADLAVASVNISKSIDGGATWFSPGTMGAAGEVSVSTDRQWFAGDRSGANQTIYLWEHEFVTQVLRMNALTNDTAWSPFASGMTDPELIAPPGSTIQNTVPGPAFVDPATHQVYGFLSASTVTTNVIGAPTGKLPNVWEADGAGTFTTGVPPGPFTNHPVFKGVIDSPISAPSPAPTPDPRAKTYGSNTSNLFNGATIDNAGNIYATWATPSGRTGLYDVWFASSRDHGKTYYGPFRINQNATQGNMPWITAGDNGRVEIVFYGTSGTEDPTTSTTDQWNVFFAQSLNAADREPVFTVSQASDHIMHVGPICNVGILCGGGTRQLLDFFQVAIGPDGLANIAYADTGSGNGTSHVSYARQSTGPLGLTNPSAVTCLPIPVPASVVSRMTHGGAGDFDVNLPLPPNASPRGVEPRSSGSLGTGNYTLVFTFPNNLTSVASASVTGHDPAGGTGTVCASGNGIGPNPNQYTVSLCGVSDQQYITVTLHTVLDVTGNNGDVVSPQMGVLIGDINASGRVDAADVSSARQQTLQTVTTSNFRNDLNASGRIDAADVSLARQDTLHSLPSAP